MVSLGKSRRASHNVLPRLAILETDPAVLEYLGQALSEQFELSLFTRPSELQNSLTEDSVPNLLLLDWHAEEDGGEDRSETKALDILAKIRASHPSLPALMLACSAELNDVIAAVRMGATDVLLKPFARDEIVQAVERCLRPAEAIVSEHDIREIPLSENVSFVRTSPRMREIESQCTLVARSDIPILVLGESGSGKEVAAMLIHKMSGRSDKPFLKVNCAAMPADLLESELFGYEQGAFTGAVKAKPGKFEVCDHGTIFLDEIGEMPPLLQAKLLQVLQDGTFSRLGSRNSVTVDVRVIAATNIDIKDAIAQKAFRADLYYRLNGFTLNMPPLRERADEVPHLAQHFMRKWSAKCSRAPLPITAGLMQALISYPWPGNVRELESVIKRFAVVGDESAIIEELCPLRSDPVIPRRADDANASAANLKVMVRSLKKNAEASVIAQSLDATSWNRKAAARDLQISYKALLYKIKQYNLIPKPKASVREVSQAV